jgi:ribose transport system permease protein
MACTGRRRSSGWAFWPALAAGLLVGLANALCIALLRVPPFMATLGTMSIAKGLALLLTNGIPIYGMPPSYVAGLRRAIVLELPIALYVAVVVVGVLGCLLNLTRIGRYIYASGGNLQAAVNSGINARGMLLLAHVLSSLLGSVTGLLLTAEIGSGQASTGESLMLESLAAAVLGGVSLRGGIGRVEMVALGAIFLLTLTNAMDLMRIDTRVQSIVLGCVLSVAVSVEGLGRRRQTVRV